MFLSRLFSQRMEKKKQATQLLREISRQSRNEVFYSHGKVPDTLEGRFELLSLHLVLVIRSLNASRSEEKSLAKRLTDHFFEELDYSLRELGTGDMVIARKMRSLGENYVGRAKGYNEALNGSDEVLTGIVHRNLLNDSDADSAERFSSYIHQLSDELVAQHDNLLSGGKINWPDPKQFFENGMVTEHGS